MQEKFAHYNLELEEVLIGTPSSGGASQIEQILTQLRNRQIALKLKATSSKIPKLQTTFTGDRADRTGKLTEPLIKSHQGSDSFWRGGWGTSAASLSL